MPVTALIEYGAASPPRQTCVSCRSISTLAGSNATAAYPAAQRMRPQLGSAPAIAVFTRGELAMARAIWAAALSLAAPLT